MQPSSERGVKTAVILAAGMGVRLQSVTNDMIPKGLLKVAGKSLVERSLEKLFHHGIETVVLVTGHLHEDYEKLARTEGRLLTVHNPDYDRTGSMGSLAAAGAAVAEDFLLLESDLIYEDRALRFLQQFSGRDCVLMSGETHSGDEVYIETSHGCIRNISKDKTRLCQIDGELVGISKISLPLLEQMLEACRQDPGNLQRHYEDLFETVGQTYPVVCEKIDDLIWAEIDDPSHLERVQSTILPRLAVIHEVEVLQ